MSFSQCRRAAASARSAEFGAQADRILRSAGVAGIFRSRAPLSVVLYVAGREGRLAWRSANSFAVLEPPPDWPRPAGGRLLRLVDRHWDLLWFGVPPTAALVAAVALIPLPAPRLAVLLLALAAMLYVTVLMVSAVLVMLIWIAGWLLRPGRSRADPAADTWSMPLVHHLPESGGADLIQLACACLVRLVTAEVRNTLPGLGAVATDVPVAETLRCPYRAGTTAATRTLLADWPRRLPPRHSGPDAVILLPTADAGREAPRQVIDSGAFFFWYVIGSAIVLLINANFVADLEREACTPGDCAGRPATYGSAVRWLGERLLLGDPSNISPATGQAWVLGWLTSIMALTAVLVFVAAVVQRTRSALRARRKFSDDVKEWGAMNRLLVMVVNDVERNAVLDAVHAANRRRPLREYYDGYPVLNLGEVSQVQVLLAQTEQGVVGAASAGPVPGRLIRALRPDYVIMVGVCYGLRQDKQSIGDILVPTQLRLVAHIRVHDDEQGRTVETQRSPNPEPTPDLLAACRLGTFDWRGAPVRFGPMISDSKLVDSPTLVRWLNDTHPDAIGGEMEAAGLYANATPAGTRWIVIKAICDWGMNKSSEWQPVAARNAADFLVHLAATRALDVPQPNRARQA
ncbi:hypothetical protein AB0H83_13260 [Dactylosporangium sp. NPDC050688]|uniref:5'-methylthioadenosine/S-adenosylhomocysteine nucleosidase family protein n=1 Tax=Dactylosporangium sp. NPDC050688 TaxID=3157217 RepID=UPI0033FFAB7F